ncbi:MAG: 4-alpha-glucanotransferase, partial [Pseudohongiellaceae bacterium]
SHPEQCSPYSPMDRRFLNPLYIDPCIEPDFCENPEIKNYTGKPAFQKRLAQLRDESLVDYRSVTRLKLVVLGKMYRHFCRTQLESGGERGRAYRSWLAAKGDSLAVFAEFEAARHRFAMDQTRHREFHCYLQWLAENQLESCQQLALQQGMVSGLVRDLAVGGSSKSAEVELNPGLFCLRASIGAPPDPLAPLGQKWGLPPLDPLQLRLSGYHHFIELLGSNMEHCGALRIDHVMSLMRLWWCPADGDSSTGAYVHYPVDELFAILRLESTRRRCVVIGEDLGVVPPEIRRYMTESAVFSNVLFYFEKYDPLHFRHPAHFPRRALAMIANHDVPPLAAWWNKSDLALRQRIGLMESETVMADAVRSRESDLIQILHWLNEQSLLPESWRDFNIHRQFDFSLCHAILQANGRCASQLVSLQLEDLSLEQMPVNIPGTSNEYPNWQRKLPTCTDQLFSAPESRTMLDIFVGARNQS